MSVLIFFGWGGAVLAVRTLPSLCMGRCSCFAHCPRLCGVERLFRGFAHMQLRAAPRSRARCSCCCARPRVRRARCPRVRCAYIPRRPTRGKCIRLASLGMSRLAFHAPSLPCAFVPRRRALLNWLALRMRVTPTAPLPRLCCGRSDGIGGGLPHRVAASTRLAACVQPLLSRGFITPSTLRPKRRGHVVYRRKRGAVMVFR